MNRKHSILGLLTYIAIGLIFYLIVYGSPAASPYWAFVIVILWPFFLFGTIIMIGLGIGIVVSITLWASGALK